jgi:hypothetical protein
MTTEQSVAEAVQWVLHRRHINPDAHTLALVEEAARRFRLTPQQQEWLLGSVASTPR